MRKTLLPQTGNRICAKPPPYLAGFLLIPTRRISRIPVVVHDSAGKKTK
jgi:hypothetical protein